MELEFKTFLIVCPLVFLAGLIDAIGGGGGIISLPAYIFAGLPTHMAIATNKLSSACGTAVATGRFIKEKLVSLKLAIPTVIAALVGSFIGAKLSLLANENLLRILMVPVLILAAIIVMNKKLFCRNEGNKDEITRRALIAGSLAAFFIGMYDGFYGPGTGTFLIVVFTVFARLSAKKSNAQAKVINLTTNLTSLAVFVMGGQVVWALGLAAAAFNMLGGFIGSSLAVNKGEKIIRPVIILVLVLLAVKIFNPFQIF